MALTNPGPAIAGFTNSVLQLATQPFQRIIWPAPLTGTAAVTNGNLGIQYFAAPYAFSASRLDALYNISYGSAATTATAGVAITGYAGIYTTAASTNSAGTTNYLSALSTGSATQSFSFASAASGATQLSVAGIRPISVPMAVNMSQGGEYYVAFAVNSGSFSTGAATTTVAFSMSNLLGGSNQSAVAYAEITAATNSTSNLWGYQGLYTSTVSAVPQTIAQSLIAQTGTNQAAGQFAFVLRNY
jgi:hypothetical protein